MITRKELATYIFENLNAHKEQIKKTYQNSSSSIGYFFIDDLLPEAIAKSIYDAFPKPEETILKRSIREHKHVAAQMNEYNPLLEEAIFAFQDKSIVNFFKEVCNVNSLFPDENLYAGGVSMMAKDNFLNPHLDNSHDKDRNHWRVFNLLYYVTPNWEENYGGNLEIWPEGVSGKPLTITSKFNRLAVMATHNKSWHSVSKVEVDKVRCCVSNYYFSEKPLSQSDSFHVTSFRGRPEERLKDIILKADTFFRMAIRKVFKKGIKENPHVYKKKDK